MPRRGVDADRHLRGPAPGATPEREVLQQQGQEVRERGRARSPSRGLTLQPSQLLVSAVAGHRLRDGDDARDRAGRTWRAWRPASPPTAIPVRVDGARAGRVRAASTCSPSHKPARYFADHRDAARAGRGVGRRGEGRRSWPFVIAGQPAAGRPGPRARREPTARVCRRLRGPSRRAAVPDFTLALVDDPLPGGHSPAYFALLHQPLPTTPYSWRNDPVELRELPAVLPRARDRAPVLGQRRRLGELSRAVDQRRLRAVLSRVLYAERTRSREDLEDILRKLRQTALANSRHGPVWLGYRLGHLQERRPRSSARSSTTRARIVLHMLRRWLGDEVFFRGVAAAVPRVGVHEDRHRARAARLRGGVGPVARALLRALDSGGPDADDRACSIAWRARRCRRRSSMTTTAPREPAVTEQISVGRAEGGDSTSHGRRHPRAARRRFRPALDGDAAVRVRPERGRAGAIVAATTEVRLPLRGVLRSVEVNRDSAALVDVER